MRLLLDTRVWLWQLQDPDRIRAETRFVLADPAHTLLLSVVSAWEIAIKHASGRLLLPRPAASFVPEQILLSGVESLDIGLSHVLAAGSLPQHHGDPFDRMLIAQAQVEDLVLVTADRAMSEYDVRLISA